ncbi:MAG: hypothetical protein VX438_09040 [Planctomycetota bacterium]|nr:hypothetical protein [Planctomycetota bacterium]
MVRCLIVIALLMFCSGCSKDSHEQVAKEYLGVMDQLVTSCDSISDPKSAETAKEKIGILLEKLKALKSRSEKLGDADETTKTKIEKKYLSELDTLTARFSETFQKIDGEKEVVKVLESEFKTLANLVNARPLN